MPSPFPGMNPYLEHPELWTEVHSRLIVAIADAIAPLARPKYRVAIEKRVYRTIDENAILIGIPDVSVQRSPTDGDRDLPGLAVVESSFKPLTVRVPVSEEVREGYLEVRDVKTGAVITVIEVLSPKNKRAGEGRNAYDRKRQQILASSTHLVEIDLLRGGQSPPISGDNTGANYRILVSRADIRPEAELYAFTLRDPIPPFPLPLQPGDAEPSVNLQTLLNELYDRAGFDLTIDYTRDPVPPVTDAERAWLDTRLQERGLR